MSVSINGTGGITFADASTQSTGGYTGFRNRIINGAMMIDQRNAGASVTPNNSYTLDRWQGQNSQTSKYTIQQSSAAPTGFKTSLLVTSSSAYSVGASDYFFVNQPIEGFNTADLAWGTASAASITMSFWVRSSLTGTFGGSIRNYNVDRSYPFSYTINSANTWEQKSVTIIGDTSGTWVGATNSVGMYVAFAFGAGSLLSGTSGSWASGNLVSATGATSVVGTNGATFYITGVQLEKGSTATPFEFRPYGQELALCQRYYWKGGYAWSGMANSTTTGVITGSYPVTMRATPTVGVIAGTGTNALNSFGDGSTNLNVVTSQGSSAGGGWVYFTSGSYTANTGYMLIVDSITASAEL